MFRFLMGVAFGAAGYWAWQSFGRDLLGLGNDQDTTYGGFNSGTSYGTGGSTGTTSYGGGCVLLHTKQRGCVLLTLYAHAR